MKTSTIILSIHPQHIEKILSGQKRYEYRKYVPTDIQHIVVYATAPIKAIVAFIDVDIVLNDNPDTIWEKTQDYSGVSKTFFMDYYREKQSAYAIHVKRVYKLSIPKSLTTLKDIIYAPQAYKYVQETIPEIYQKLGISIMNENRSPSSF